MGSSYRMRTARVHPRRSQPTTFQRALSDIHTATCLGCHAYAAEGGALAGMHAGKGGWACYADEGGGGGGGGEGGTGAQEGAGQDLGGQRGADGGVGTQGASKCICGGASVSEVT